MKMCKTFVILVMFIVLILPTASQAFAVEHGSTVYINKSQIVDGNLYAAGTNIIVDGHVTGDLYCAGQALNINGTVDGDVLCAGQTVSVNGNVGGSVRAVGSNIEIRGKVARGLNLAGANIDFAKEAVVGWDALVAAANANMSGTIGRSLIGAGANFILGGTIGKDTVLYLGNNKSKTQTELTILESAVLGGTLNYTSQTAAEISPKAQVKSKVNHNLPTVSQRNPAGTSGVFVAFIFALLSALVIGLVLMSIWKKPLFEITNPLAQRFWPLIGWGAIFTIVAPVCLFLVAITIIGLRLALITFLVWIVILMLAKIVAAIAIGRLVLDRIADSKKKSSGWILACGIGLSWLVFYLPLIGWLASLVAIWWGSGALLVYLKDCFTLSKTNKE